MEKKFQPSSILDPNVDNTHTFFPSQKQNMKVSIIGNKTGSHEFTSTTKRRFQHAQNLHNSSTKIETKPFKKNSLGVPIEAINVEKQVNPTLFQSVAFKLKPTIIALPTIANINYINNSQSIKDPNNSEIIKLNNTSSLSHLQEGSSVSQVHEIKRYPAMTVLPLHKQEVQHAQSGIVKTIVDDIISTNSPQHALEPTWSSVMKLTPAFYKNIPPKIESSSSKNSGDYRIDSRKAPPKVFFDSIRHGDLNQNIYNNIDVLSTFQPNYSYRSNIENDSTIQRRNKLRNAVFVSNKIKPDIVSLPKAYATVFQPFTIDNQYDERELRSNVRPYVLGGTNDRGTSAPRNIQPRSYKPIMNLKSGSKFNTFDNSSDNIRFLRQIIEKQSQEVKLANVLSGINSKTNSQNFVLNFKLPDPIHKISSKILKTNSSNKLSESYFSDVSRQLYKTTPLNIPKHDSNLPTLARIYRNSTPKIVAPTVVAESYLTIDTEDITGLLIGKPSTQTLKKLLPLSKSKKDFLMQKIQEISSTHLPNTKFIIKVSISNDPMSTHTSKNYDSELAENLSKGNIIMIGKKQILTEQFLQDIINKDTENPVLPSSATEFSAPDKIIEFLPLHSNPPLPEGSRVTWQSEYTEDSAHHPGRRVMVLDPMEVEGSVSSEFNFKR